LYAAVNIIKKQQERHKKRYHGSPQKTRKHAEGVPSFFRVLPRFPQVKRVKAVIEAGKGRYRPEEPMLIDE
jgi:hypothetical protein